MEEFYKNELKYRNAFKEVYEILKYVPDEDKRKIPKDFMNVIKNNMNEEYEFKINQDFKDLVLLEETKAVLAIIYRDFWATEEEKRAINNKFKNDILKSLY